MGQRFGIHTSFGMLFAFAMCFVPTMARGQGDVSGEKIYRQALRSVAWILSPKGNGFLSSGTGSLIDAKGKLLITNYHVVGENEHVIVLFPAYRNGNKLVTERSHYLDSMKAAGIPATVQHLDRGHDLALIKLDSIPAGIVPLRLAHDNSGPGQRVHSIGNP